MADNGEDFHKFAAELAAAGPQVVKKVHGRLTAHTNRIAANARRAAPKDRPWLSTRGIQTDTRLMARRVFTVLDTSKKDDGHPEGTDIGVEQEFGNSHQAPRPFLLPAFEAQRQPFVTDVEAILAEAL